MALLVLSFLLPNAIAKAADGRVCASSGAQTEAVAFDIAVAYLKAKARNAASLECMTFILVEDTASQVFRIDIRERHGDNCAGDPAAAPKVMSLLIDRENGCVQEDGRFD